MTFFLVLSIIDLRVTVQYSPLVVFLSYFVFFIHANPCFLALVL